MCSMLLVITSNSRVVMYGWQPIVILMAHAVELRAWLDIGERWVAGMGLTSYSMIPLMLPTTLLVAVLL